MGPSLSYKSSRPAWAWLWETIGFWCLFVCFCFYVCFVFFETGFLCIAELRNPPASASWVLGLKVCTTTARLIIIISCFTCNNTCSYACAHVHACLHGKPRNWKYSQPWVTMCELGINLGNLQEHPWEMAGIISPAPRLFKKKKKNARKIPWITFLSSPDFSLNWFQLKHKFKNLWKMWWLKP